MTASWHADTAYAAFQSRPIDIDARVIANRWERLCPWVLDVIRRSCAPDPADALHQMRLVHAERFMCLVRAGIKPKTIAKHALDDPVALDDVFARKMSRSLDVRRGKLVIAKRTKERKR